ncbi:DUF2971 domain-containing protein [Lacinutrix sp. WUR7]|uniref:DUF2971 domain-containing protein n=1 Tax=Lacinutrix sp. WUR7 TaxID=2653681 RepID=UPI00193E8F5D|nr:DUF2971 domain-containing protein [Lacinutrix sp. WUR7]QRM90544.1 DUF2971 domain-containing protein [Lacinutrix sp. WUR7]
MKKGYTIDEKYFAEWNRELKQWDYLENGELIPESNKTLYKYLSWNEKTISSLLGNYLWLSNPVHFNDPFDCNRGLIFNYKFSEEEKTQKRNYFNDIGIISFTENQFCPLMWAHYTGNYNGIVLKFKAKNFNKFKNENQFNGIKLRKVVYPEKLKQFPDGFSFSKELMLFTKTKNWRYEKEWRLIANLKKPYNRFLRFDPQDLEEIYIGHNLFEMNSSAIQILTQIRDTYYPKTKLTRIFPDSEVFGQIVFRDWVKELDEN